MARARAPGEVVARARGGGDVIGGAGVIGAVFVKAGSSRSGKYRKPDVHHLHLAIKDITTLSCFKLVRKSY